MSRNHSFPEFATRLREFIALSGAQRSDETGDEKAFNRLALDLFRLQFAWNAPYRTFCLSRGVSPERISHWNQIPAIPAAAFKELEFTCLQPGEACAVFHSSGTTEQRPSRHLHSRESLSVYRSSLLPWFRAHLLPELPGGERSAVEFPALPRFAFLTPEISEVPQSSLVYMFQTIVKELALADARFLAHTRADGGWDLDVRSAEVVLLRSEQKSTPVAILGTAFSFVQLLDHLEANQRIFRLPLGSRAMETGGYKGRSRTLPKPELHALIQSRLGIPADFIVSEYGMSELSSQAYDLQIGDGTVERNRLFRFPPWARAVVVSPENVGEVQDGETGLLRICDLANVWSVMFIQTEDLATRRGTWFELVGRAQNSEPRGCSLMAVS